MITIGIITAPRPRETLYASIQSLVAAGFDDHDVMVFADGPVRNEVRDTTNARILSNIRPLGNLRNWAHALKTIFEWSHEDWYMICEDDITWAQGSMAALVSDLDWLVKKDGALSLYCPINISNYIERFTSGPIHPGWYPGERKGMKVWGAQCFAFSRANAERLLNDIQFQSYLVNPKYHKNVDAIVAKCIHDMGHDIWYRIPCLVNHDLGDANSSLGYPDDRPKLRTKYFTGQP